MDSVTQQNAALVQQAAQAAASLSSQAAQLQAVVGEFKLDADDAPAGPALGQAQQPRLSAA